MFFVSCGIEYIDNNISKNIEVEEKKLILDGKNINKGTNEDKYISNRVDENTSEEIANEEYDWYIEIPKIELYAPIEEGTNDEILNKSVGHFEDTSRRNGNCGLAAHNRGYNVNYFSRLKELKKGDIVYYFVDGKKYKYKIEDSFIIYETDWSVLEDTEDNIITLITCVENREEYRLCVKGVLVDE